LPNPRRTLKMLPPFFQKTSMNAPSRSVEVTFK
jgi:hypothetical protein